MNYQSVEVARLKKPKRKALKIVLFTILAVILAVGLWVGITAYKAIKKVTALSSGNNSLLSLFTGNQGNLRGQNEGRTNILLMGIGGANHPGANLSDTMQVVSINWQTNQIAMISIPRDLWVKIPDDGYSKINEANSSGGGELASTVVSQVLGIPIHYFVTLDFSGFTEIVDTLGGIDVNVPKAIYDRNYPAYDNGPVTTFSISAGPHHMDGALALKYVRSRESTSDFDRSKRQQLVMEAIKTKIMTAGTLANPEKITTLLNSISNHIKMSLGVGDIKSLYEEFKKIDTSQMISKVLDNSTGNVLVSSQTSGGGYILIPKKGIGNYSDIQSIAKNIFSSKDDNLSAKSNPVIEVLNGSGVAGRGTTAANTLKANGYKVSSVGTTSKTTSTVVYNCAGSSVEKTAQKIADILNSTVQSKTYCGAIDIEVIIGQN